MKTLLLSLVLLNAITTGCGSSTKQEITADDANKYIDEHTKAMDKDFKKEVENSQESASPTACQVIVAFSLAGLHYSPELVSWGDAVNKTPPGKRLATRGELLLLHDSGMLKGIQFASDGVWSGSERDQDTAWVLGTTIGSLDYTQKVAVLGAIYVDKK